jgi:hypothetical protein
MEYMLAVALKAKMAWFDHPRVNRTDSNFVDFFAVNPVEIHHARRQVTFLSRESRPSIMPGPITWMEPNWLEPRVTFWLNAKLFCHFPFKQMHLWAVGRQ